MARQRPTRLVMGLCIVEIDRIVIRDVQYQLEVNRCRNEEFEGSSAYSVGGDSGQDGRTDGRSDGGDDHNIPTLFKKHSIVQSNQYFKMTIHPSQERAPTSFCSTKDRQSPSRQIAEKSAACTPATESQERSLRKTILLVRAFKCPLDINMKAGPSRSALEVS
ncbi:hypothetical protein DPMN_026799 [Dreissena polymorpha]|uniref:Uncharacterized protein n=1 Tax=Dreissena polymorpha TaxID=45954 RepID=A0A9D4LU32_DREPO|nr:hypothetical protein DPMN_026799 [Dreissena polymorpha]